jgi:hypothetical protein
MSKLTAKETQEKHARRLKGAIEDMRTGIEKVTSSPTAAAANKQDKMKAKIVAAIDSGKWANGLRSVSLEEWKEKITTKGLPRIATGIDGASGKVEKFYTQLLPHIDRVQADVKKMPDLTIEDSINRMSTFIRGMAKFSFKK